MFITLVIFSKSLRTVKNFSNDIDLLSFSNHERQFCVAPIFEQEFANALKRINKKRFNIVIILLKKGSSQVFVDINLES